MQKRVRGVSGGCNGGVARFCIGGESERSPWGGPASPAGQPQEKTGVLSALGSGTRLTEAE
jgi:hypothetical protein